MRSGSHRSTMSRKSSIGSRSHHRSSMSSRMHRSSLSGRRSSLHRSSFSKNSSTMSHRARAKRAFDSHAFSVGRATGVRINGSHEASHGAALHSASTHKFTRPGSMRKPHGTGRFSGSRRRMKVVSVADSAINNSLDSADVVKGLSAFGIIFVVMAVMMFLFFAGMMILMFSSIFTFWR